MSKSDLDSQSNSPKQVKFLRRSKDLCRSYPEPDDVMSFSAMDGTDYCIVFVEF